MRWLFVLLLACSAAFADAPPTTAPAETVVVHCNGIGGELPIDHRFARALCAALGPGVTYQIADAATASAPGLRMLGATDANRAFARQLAADLAALRRARPGARVVLTSHSAGAGVAAWALEALPAGGPPVVDAWVMAAPALSPGYDLAPALARVGGGTLCYTSVYDGAVLGTLTRAFGTVDRVRCAAAGSVGFDRPERYAPLGFVARPFDRAWMARGNVGDHLGAIDPQFAAEVMADDVRRALVPRTPRDEPRP